MPAFFIFIYQPMFLSRGTKNCYIILFSGINVIQNIPYSMKYFSQFVLVKGIIIAHDKVFPSYDGGTKFQPSAIFD